MLNDKMIKEVVSDYFSGYKRDYFMFNICLTSDISIRLLKEFTNKKDAELGLSTMRDGDLYSLYLFYLHTLDNPFVYIEDVGSVLQNLEDWESCNTDDIIKYVDELVSNEDVRKDFLRSYRWEPSCYREVIYLYEQFNSIANRVYALIERNMNFNFELALLGTILSRVNDLGETLKTCELRYGVSRTNLKGKFYRKYSNMDDVHNTIVRLRAQSELCRVQNVNIVQ